MYEREHVKRGIIFVKERAFSAEFTIKATDSEGTTRSIKVQNSTGANKYDVKTDMVAGAMHAALESVKDASTTSNAWQSFTVSQYPSYIELNTGIRIWWSDDSTHHRFNGAGGAAADSGSNYSRGYITFVTHPIDAATVQIDGGSDTYTYEFDDNGSVTPGNTAVTIGATVDETAENLVAAINSVTTSGVGGAIFFRATLLRTDGQSPSISITSTTEGDISGSNGGDITLNANGGSTFAVRGHVTGGDTSTGAAASEAPVRFPITFERLSIEDSAGTAQTSGSVISWYASYPTKAEADASLINIEIGDSYGDTMVETFTYINSSF